jgi:hypothetical protein
MSDSEQIFGGYVSSRETTVKHDPRAKVCTEEERAWQSGTTECSVDWPIIANLRLDPFERRGLPTASGGSLAFYNWFVCEIWRFVFVQQEIGKAGRTFLQYPPMQKGATFNLAALKEELEK